MPGPCNGAPSCACQSGFACGSNGTSPSTRMGYFDTVSGGWGENIARGNTDPVASFQQWIFESTTNTACGFHSNGDNGHRYNILNGGNKSVGVGRSSSTWTMDLTGAGTPDGIVAGVHYPQTGSNLAFRASWYKTSPAPSAALVNIDGTCTALAVERGTQTNGTWLASVSPGSGCHHYFFQFTAGATDYTYPSTGSSGIGCTEDWSSTRPGACGCTPTCTGKQCGPDGCGGTCGTCTAPATCRSSGQCVCTPACAGKQCGPDGCGGTRGTCAVDRECNASQQCACQSPLEECAGACVDKSNSEEHCGSCGLACDSGDYCVGGVCTPS